tara:strand:- start:568 stop:843 length:276 start_codon:yes stop_codon:yes gene_type:complete
MVDPNNVFGFNYILENNDYYIDISCKVYESSEYHADGEWVEDIYIDKKTHSDDLSMQEREHVLGESYEVVMVTNEDIKIVKDCRIPYYGTK